GNVLAAVHPVLADGAAGVGSEVLEARGVGCRGRDDRRVLHRTGILERALDGGDRGTLLADGNVDAAHLLVDVARVPVGLLVDDRVDRDRGLTGLTVADDELALATADGDHRVNRLDAGLHGLVNTLALHDARSLKLECATSLGLDGAETVDGVAERVDDATEVSVTNGNREHLARAGDLHARLDAGELTEHDDTDLTLVEVQGKAQGAV